MGPPSAPISLLPGPSGPLGPNCAHEGRSKSQGHSRKAKKASGAVVYPRHPVLCCTQGGYTRTQGSYKGPQGRYTEAQGGYAGPQGGYTGAQGRYTKAQGGYTGAQGAYKGPQGGYTGAQGGYTGPQGGYTGAQPAPLCLRRVPEWHRATPREGPGASAHHRLPAVRHVVHQRSRARPATRLHALSSQTDTTTEEEQRTGDEWKVPAVSSYAPDPEFDLRAETGEESEAYVWEHHPELLDLVLDGTLVVLLRRTGNPGDGACVPDMDSAEDSQAYSSRVGDAAAADLASGAADVAPPGGAAMSTAPASPAWREGDGSFWDEEDERRRQREQPEVVYLIGTAHLSARSAQAVGRVIRAVHPDNVVVELCRSRVGAMYSSSNVSDDAAHPQGSSSNPRSEGPSADAGREGEGSGGEEEEEERRRRTRPDSAGKSLLGISGPSMQAALGRSLKLGKSLRLKTFVPVPPFTLVFEARYVTTP